jgi:hypothetical protein
MTAYRRNIPPPMSPDEAQAYGLIDGVLVR